MTDYRAIETLLKIAELAGEDGEAIEAARSGAMKYPTIEQFAINAVEQLRKDYDEMLKEGKKYHGYK